MDRTIGIVGGDRRFECLARLMRADGRRVSCYGGSWIAPQEDEEEALCAERIVLPVPLCRKQGELNGRQGIPLDGIWRRLSPRQDIFAGGVREEERAAAQEYGLTLTDYYTREALTVRNAVPTAEGAIQIAMERLPVTLHGLPCLVIGFGRIGKLLSHDLKALGAEVSVSARRLEDLAWIDAFGCRPLHTNRLDGMLGDFRAVFNTVPHPVLGETLLRQLRGDCLLVELASGAGINGEAAREMGLNYVKANGLPGRAAPESAALALKETLYQLWEEGER